MEEAGLFPADLGALDVMLGATSEASAPALLSLSRELRAAGFSVSMAPRAEKPAKQRKAADERGAAFALCIEDGRVQLWQRQGDSIVSGLDIAAVVSALKERAR
jgi:histidyl-tRNA synthetase